MTIHELNEKFSHTAEQQEKAIFSSLFILTNRLQTIFDQQIPGISLKQFMLLSLVRQAQQPTSLSQLAQMLGCSRQNVKKLAISLEKKDMVKIQINPNDPRALSIFSTEEADRFFENDFAVYQKDLRILFDCCTEEETAQLLGLLMKLYDGLNHLETSAALSRPAQTVQKQPAVNTAEQEERK